MPDTEECEDRARADMYMSIKKVSLHRMPTSTLIRVATTWISETTYVIWKERERVEVANAVMDTIMDTDYDKDENRQSFSLRGILVGN